MEGEGGGIHHKKQAPCWEFGSPLLLKKKREKSFLVLFDQGIPR